MLNINQMTSEQKFFHNMTRQELIVAAIINLLNEGERQSDITRTAITHDDHQVGGMALQLTCVKIGKAYNWFIGQGFAPITREDLGIILFEIIWNC